MRPTTWTTRRVLGRLLAVIGLSTLPGLVMLDLTTTAAVQATDVDTAHADLPPFEGPSEPAGGHVHEWGNPAAEMPEDSPLEGPALAPYGQAARSE